MNVRHLFVLAAVSIGVVSLSACRDNDDTNDVMAETSDAVPVTNADPTDESTDAMASTDQPDVQASMAERNALGVLNAINEHEIAAGKQALSKGVEGPVAAYAQMMIDQHTENRDKTSALSPESAAPDADAQRKKGEQALAMLDEKSGDAYSKAYVAAMVKDHTEALAALDSKLIPAAGRAEVTTHLAATREHVANHLAKAKQLESAAN